MPVICAKCRVNPIGSKATEMLPFCDPCIAACGINPSPGDAPLLNGAEEQGPVRQQSSNVRDALLSLSSEVLEAEIEKLESELRALKLLRKVARARERGPRKKPAFKKSEKNS